MTQPTGSQPDKNEQPLLLLVAGPNGAGKTTYVERILGGLGLPFINADQIAKALAPDNPNSVALLTAQRADELRDQGIENLTSMITETVFSDQDRRKLRFIQRAQ